MRRTILFAGAMIIFLVCTDAVNAQKFDTLWTQVYWNGYFDSANCVDQTSDGGYIITGVTRQSGQLDTDLSLIKTDSLGNMEWQSILGDTISECGFHVLQTNDGGYFVSGQRYKPNDGIGKIWAIKFDAGGDSVWAFIHDAADTRSNGYPYYAIETSDGGYAITGVTNFNYDNKAYILRLDGDGAFLDFDTCSAYSYQDGVFITEMPDHGFMVAGNFNDPYSTQYDFWVYRTNSAGSVLWDSLYVITDYTDLMYGACRDDDGIVMVGVARGESWAHKIDFDGHTVWSKSISINFTNETVTSICPTDDGGYMVGGMVWVTGHRRDFCFTKLDSVLDTMWTYTVGGTEDDHGQCIAPTLDGGFVMAGPSYSFVNGTSFYLVKGRSYFCGDANGDDIVDVGDAVYLVGFIFRGGEAPVLGYCHGDANGDGLTDVGDVVYLISYIFRGGEPPLDVCCQ